MASLELELHPVTPQSAKLARVAKALRNGAVLLYPTETGFALGCDLSNKSAIDRVRDIRNANASKPLTFLCDSLSNIAEFAKVSNAAYKMLKRLIPGPYTFILPATKAVPKYAVNPKRKTSGIRVPDHPISLALLRELGNPIISITAKNGDIEPPDTEELLEQLTPRVDVVIRSQEYNFAGKSSVLDMTSDEFTIVRHGAGMNLLEELLPNSAV